MLIQRAEQQSAGVPEHASVTASRAYPTVFRTVALADLSGNLVSCGLDRMDVGGIAMTTLLEHAFAKAATLTTAEQDVLASRLLAELADEDDFDRAIAATSDKLAILARQALAEHKAGLTEELDPDCL